MSNDQKFSKLVSPTAKETLLQQMVVEPAAIAEKVKQSTLSQEAKELLMKTVLSGIGSVSEISLSLNMAIVNIALWLSLDPAQYARD
jgi:hypothetical protein